jgi:inward rectifier potassium channel
MEMRPVVDCGPSGSEQFMATQQHLGEINRDLGLGSRVAQESRQRFLNRDGSFNVERHGLPLFRSLNLYHWLLSIPWAAFFLLVAFSYLLANVVFAAGYVACGPGALRGAGDPALAGRFLTAFFFSVQTIATIGYGGISPHGLAANALVTVESLAGLLGFALATGLLFARFSRPNAKIVFSRNAVVAPYLGITALEFRIANARSSQLLNVDAVITLSRFETIDGRPRRKFHELALERRNVVFFPLHWVIVHPIDERSPLFGVTREQFEASDAEILVMLTAIDETFSQPVHARTSYKHAEVLWGARFADIFLPSRERIAVDLRRLSDVRQV